MIDERAKVWPGLFSVGQKPLRWLAIEQGDKILIKLVQHFGEPGVGGGIGIVGDRVVYYSRGGGSLAQWSNG